MLNEGLVVDIMRYVSLKGCGMGFNRIVGVRGRGRRGVIDDKLSGVEKKWSRHSIGVLYCHQIVDYWTINGTQGCIRLYVVPV